MTGITVTMTVTKNGVSDVHTLSDLEGSDLKNAGLHFIDHALKKTMAMAPDNAEDNSLMGNNTVSFTWEAVRQSDGMHFGGQTNTFPPVNDAAAATLIGALDGAIHQLDKRLAGKYKHYGRKK